jgi:hypothetical protein
MLEDVSDKPHAGAREIGKGPVVLDKTSRLTPDIWRHRLYPGTRVLSSEPREARNAVFSCLFGYQPGAQTTLGDRNLRHVEKMTGHGRNSHCMLHASRLQSELPDDSSVRPQDTSNLRHANPE